MADVADMDGVAGATWWLYMIECRGGGIYTGIAIDVDLRYEKHASGRGARYARINPPVRLLCRHPFPDRQGATRAEYVVKRLSLEHKWEMATSGLFGEAVAAIMARRESR